MIKIDTNEEGDWFPSVSDAEDIVNGFVKKEFKVLSKKIIEQSRWEICYEYVVKHTKSKRFFRAFRWVGSTEVQDTDEWEENRPEFHEVFPVEKTVVVYMSKRELEQENKGD